MNVTYQLSPRQVEELHALYQNESWSAGRSLEETARCVSGSSICIGLVDANNSLKAFTRVITDYTFKALIFDVIVAPDQRDQGLGDRLIQLVKEHQQLQAVKHFELYCLPALEPFYERHGFSTEVSGMRLMRRITG